MNIILNLMKGIFILGCVIGLSKLCLAIVLFLTEANR